MDWSCSVTSSRRRKSPRKINLAFLVNKPLGMTKTIVLPYFLSFSGGFDLLKWCCFCIPSKIHLMISSRVPSSGNFRSGKSGKRSVTKIRFCWHHPDLEKCVLTGLRDQPGWETRSTPIRNGSIFLPSRGIMLSLANSSSDQPMNYLSNFQNEVLYMIAKEMSQLLLLICAMHLLSIAAVIC